MISYKVWYYVFCHIPSILISLVQRWILVAKYYSTFYIFYLIARISCDNKELRG